MAKTKNTKNRNTKLPLKKKEQSELKSKPQPTEVPEVEEVLEVTVEQPSITEENSSDTEATCIDTDAPETALSAVSEDSGDNPTTNESEALTEPLTEPEEETTNAGDDEEVENTDRHVERETLFGVDVTEMGLEYPSSKHRVSIEFRKTVKKLEKMLFSVTDGSIEDIANNFKVGLNKLEDRMANNRKCHMNKSND